MTPPFVARRGALAVAFGILGLAAGWATADFFCLSSASHELVLRWALLSVTPLAAAAIGGLVARSLASAWWKAVALVTVVTLAVGALLGLVLAEATRIPINGAASGFAAAAVFLPAVLLIFFAERRVGRARPGSVVAGIDGRAVAAAVAFSVAFGVVVAIPPWFFSAHRPDRPSPDGPLTFAVLAIAALVVVLVSDIHALIVARRCASEVGSMSPRDADSSDPRRFVDLGVGDAWVELAVRPVTAYRGAAEVLASIRGDAVVARRIAWRAVIRGVIALAVAARAMTFAVGPNLADRVDSSCIGPPPAAAETANPSPSEVEAATADDSVGVVECDQYFADVERCFGKNPALRAAMQDSMKQNREAWRAAARTEVGREALVKSCTMAREAVAQSCK